MPEDTATPSPMEIPSAPRTTILKAAVIVMGVLLVAGFGLVIATIVMRASKPQVNASLVGPGGRFGVSNIGVNPGDRVRTLTMTDERLAIHMAGDKGEEIIIVNVKSGVELGRIRLHPLTDLAASGR
jgi:hypothetical protein